MVNGLAVFAQFLLFQNKRDGDIEIFPEMAQSISVNGSPGNIQPTIVVGEIAYLISFSYVSSFLSASIDYLYGGKPFGTAMPTINWFTNLPYFSL